MTVASHANCTIWRKGHDFYQQPSPSRRPEAIPVPPPAARAESHMLYKEAVDAVNRQYQAKVEAENGKMRAVLEMAQNENAEHKRINAARRREGIDWEVRQCEMCALPGYTGYMPTKYPTSGYGITYGDLGKRSKSLCVVKPARIVSANHVPVKLPEKPEDHWRLPAEWTKTYKAKEAWAPELPATTRVFESHRVPHIPGYAGYIPGKRAENIMGGGVTYCAKAAKKIFDTREELNPDKRLRGLWADMDQYYAWADANAAGDDLWKDPNFLRRAYTNGAYKMDSCMSVTRKTFNVKHGHKCEIKPWPS